MDIHHEWHSHEWCITKPLSGYCVMVCTTEAIEFKGKQWALLTLPYSPHVVYEPYTMACILIHRDELRQVVLVRNSRLKYIMEGK